MDKSHMYKGRVKGMASLHMEQKLRKRFVLTGFTAILIMLLFVDIGFRSFSYNQLKTSLDRMLTYIIEHKGVSDMTETETEAESGGKPAKDEDPKDEEGQQESAAFDQKSSPEDQNPVSRLVDIMREFGDSVSGNVEFTPESRYRMRYFLVSVDGSGQISNFSLSHIAAVKDDAAEELALQHYKLHKKSGLFEYGGQNYYYKIVPEEDGSTTVGFLECTMEVSNLQAMRRIVILVCMCVIVMFTVILTFLAGHAIQPYVENIESQRQFITTAGHELKTPLAIISANTEVIEMMNGPSEWTDSIKAQVKRSTGLINGMLALARMNETQKVELTDVSLSEIVSESAKSFQTVISQQQKVLECGIEDQIHILGDENLLTELSNILIDNAAKYCDDGGTITVTLKKRGKSGAQLQVSNDYKDGKGQDFRKFFQRFYRADTSHNSNKGGHGIGLSMAQSIAAKMKGTINASWKDGRITFTVNL